MLSRKFQLMCIIIICLSIYYPVLFNTTLSIDDVDMVGRMTIGSFSWTSVFSPSSSFYYRPLLILTFWFDLWMWNLEPTFSLLENAFLHALNACLVFFIFESFYGDREKHKYLPLTAAIIMAIHPLATESINWMSGRTDLLATFFVLAAVLVLRKSMARGSYFLLGSSLLLYIAAIMSKEVVVFFLPALLYLFLVWNRDVSIRGFKTSWLPAFLLCCPFFVVVVSYLLQRMTKFQGRSDGFAYILDRIHYEGIHLIRVPFKVFGFYVKKIFLPWPLNFAIINVNDYYVVLGVLVFFLVLWVLIKGGKRYAFIVIACYMIIPGIVIALTHIAWTPLAERYAYLSSAFMAIGIVASIQPLLSVGRLRKFFALLLCLWSVPSAYACVHRSILWQDKSALYADTLKKSPEFAQLRNELGVALLNNGNSDEALVQFQKGQTKFGSEEALLNEARLLLIEEKTEDARAKLLENVDNFGEMSVKALKMLTVIDRQRLQENPEDNQEEKASIRSELLTAHLLIYEKNHDPFELYRSGQLALSYGDKARAQDLFSQAYEKAADSAHYKEAAGTLADKLQNEGSSPN